MKLSEHLVFLALMIPTILLLTAGAVSLAWPAPGRGMPEDPPTLAITQFLHAQLEDDFVSR